MVGLQLQTADASGRFITTPTQRVRQNDPPSAPWNPVVLASNQTASFDVYGQLYDALHDRPCPVTDSASIVPPGDSSPLVIPLQIPNCGLLNIAPLVKGDTDRAFWAMEVPPYVIPPPVVKKSR